MRGSQDDHGSSASLRRKGFVQLDSRSSFQWFVLTSQPSKNQKIAVIRVIFWNLDINMSFWINFTFVINSPSPESSFAWI